MSWLISMMLAGALFASANMPINQLRDNYSLRNFNQTDETERIDQTYPFNPNGRIEVSNVNGSITIETWDKPEIKFEAVKTAESRERLADLNIKIDAGQNNFKVEADYGSWKNRDKSGWTGNGRLVANFTLIVPRTAVLDEIQTVNGSVSISNSMSFTKASTVNGTVRCVNLQGNADLSTVNGSVEAAFDQMSARSMISLSTVNGRANLIIPSDADATLRASSVNGGIVNDFGLPVRKGKYVGRDMYGKIGSGEVKIKLESVNGGLAVKRKNDGKTLNPATNLLQQKSNDDEDNNDDNDTFGNDFDAAMNDSRREMENAARTANKAINVAEMNAQIAEAMKEVKKIKPEMPKIVDEALKQANVEMSAANARKAEMLARSKEIKAIAADERFPWRAPFLVEENGSYQVKGTPTIRIETNDCAISVRGWDKPEVKYSLTKVSSNIKQQTTEFSAAQKDASSIEIKAANESGNYSNSEQMLVRLEVFVPKNSNLKIITDAEVRLDSISGEMDLQGADETINIRDASGKLKLKAEDGTVRVIGFRGDLESQMSDGEMYLEGDFQNLNANVEDGTIYLTLPNNTNATITTNSDSVRADGLELKREPNSGERQYLWRIGSGGRDFKFNMSDGNLIIRSQNNLNAEL